MEETKPRITVVTAWLMVTTAFFLDVLQFFLSFILMGWLVVPIALLTFYVWFKLHDVGFLERFGAKKIIAYIGVPVIEILSLGIAPGITTSVAITIFIVRFEDSLIERGIITREDLRTIEMIVLKTGKAHGFKSPQFNHALAQNLGKEASNRFNNRGFKELPEMPQKAKVYGSLSRKGREINRKNEEARSKITPLSVAKRSQGIDSLANANTTSNQKREEQNRRREELNKSWENREKEKRDMFLDKEYGGVEKFKATREKNEKEWKAGTSNGLKDARAAYLKEDEELNRAA